MGAADWLTLFTHFLSLSLLAVGGAITTAPTCTATWSERSTG
jgi:chromate transporter